MNLGFNFDQQVPNDISNHLHSYLEYIKKFDKYMNNYALKTCYQCNETWYYQKCQSQSNYFMCFDCSKNKNNKLQKFSILNELN